MISILFTILGCVGLTYIIMFSPLLESFRSFISSKGELPSYLIKCPSCCGTWAGLLGTILYTLGLEIILLPFGIGFVVHLVGLYYFFTEED